MVCIQNTQKETFCCIFLQWLTKRHTIINLITTVLVNEFLILVNA